MAGSNVELWYTILERNFEWQLKIDLITLHNSKKSQRAKPILISKWRVQKSVLKHGTFVWRLLIAYLFTCIRAAVNVYVISPYDFHSPYYFLPYFCFCGHSSGWLLWRKLLATTSPMKSSTQAKNEKQYSDVWKSLQLIPNGFCYLMTEWCRKWWMM